MASARHKSNWSEHGWRRCPHHQPPGISSVQFFDPIVKTGAAFYDCAGSSEKSKEIWILARVEGDFEVAPGDSVCPFLLLVYKSASSRVPVISCKPVRLVNATTLNDGLLYPLTRVVRNSEERTCLEEAADLAVEKIRLHFNQLAERFRSMTRVEMSQERLQAYYEGVFPNPDPAKANQRLRERFARIVAERPSGIAACARLFVEGKGNNLPGVKGSLWAAYGALAEYVDYWMAEDDEARLGYVFASPLKAYAMGKATQIMRAP